MIDKVVCWILGALIVLTGVSVLVQTSRLHMAQLEISQLKLDAARVSADAAAASAVKQQEARTTEQELNTGAAATRKETNEQVQAAGAQYAALLGRLRVAESNLATARLVSRVTAAASAGSAPADDAAGELPGQLGEADVREAQRAETIRLHLVACYADYERARLALKQH